eukprot:758328-Hanusia_phi.AAC.7
MSMGSFPVSRVGAGELAQSLQATNSNLNHFRFEHSLPCIPGVITESCATLQILAVILQEHSPTGTERIRQAEVRIGGCSLKLAEQKDKELEEIQNHLNKKSQTTDRALYDLQVQLNDARNGKALVEAELHSAEQDILKLKSVIKYATDAVRKAAEQRTELTAMVNEGCTCPGVGCMPDEK